MASRYLYLARHGEALADQSGLTEKGRRQAELLGERLRDVRFSAVHHSPLPRAVQTARLISEQLEKDAPMVASELVGDYIPYVPERQELPSDSADSMLQFLAQATEEELEMGPPLATQALAEFTGPVDEDQHDLIITHNFQVAWFVREALAAPRERWEGLDSCNTGLTVIRYATGRPAVPLVFNDLGHLPVELRCTGF
jgi:probable phosphoglycerate mutase